MLRILLVEDDSDVAFVISMLLEDAGYHVTVASDGHIGLDIAMQEQPELIITDFMMPMLSGIEMITRLRDLGYTRPIILCSAVSEDRFPANQVQYDAFLLKPYRSEELLAKIEELRKRNGSDNSN